MHFLKDNTQKELKELVSDDNFEEMFYGLKRAFLNHTDEHILSTLTRIMSQELNIKEEKEEIIHYFLKLAYFARDNKND